MLRGGDRMRVRVRGTGNDVCGFGGRGGEGDRAEGEGKSSFGVVLGGGVGTLYRRAVRWATNGELAECAPRSPFQS